MIKMVDLGRRVEYYCMIGLEVKLIGEWRTMNGGGRKEDGFVTIVMLETVTRNELEKVLKV